MSAIELMFPPFVAAMLLVAIHGYFGLHVIARGVIHEPGKLLEGLRAG